MQKSHIHIVRSLAQPVGKLWKKYQKEYTHNGNFIVASPISNTPIPIYEWVTDHAKEFSNLGQSVFSHDG